MTKAKKLEDAVDTEVKAAQKDAKTGDVETVKETQGGPEVDLPTNARSHPPE